MSLKTWKQEFYPVDAEDVVSHGANYDEIAIDMIKHSLTKWRGLTKDNLDKHDLVQDWRYIKEATLRTFEIDGYSCSLCCEYRNITFKDPCEQCPITIATGIRQDTYGARVDPCSVEYHCFLDDGGGPEPMIRLLERTLEFYEARAVSAEQGVSYAHRI